jgi:hypothetical protein
MNVPQSEPVRGSVRSTAIVAFGVAAVSVAIVAIVALGGLGGRGPAGGDGGFVIPPPSANPTAPAVTPEPTSEPTAKPTAKPSSRPSTTPTPAPTDGGIDAMPIKVDLDNATGAHVYVDIVDETGLLTAGASGTPGDGASVDYRTLDVESLDPRTLQLTWSDYPIDSALALTIDRFDGKLRLLLARPEPTTETDAMGFDRVLILTFSEPVSADDVTAVVQEGYDTAG